jgi:hypothetical protein
MARRSSQLFAPTAGLSSNCLSQEQQSSCCAVPGAKDNLACPHRFPAYRATPRDPIRPHRNMSNQFNASDVMLELGKVIRELREEYSRMQSDLTKLDSAIIAIESAAGARAASSTTSTHKNRNAKHDKGPRRIFSVAARRRISEAQKARWAKFRADKRKRAS